MTVTEPQLPDEVNWLQGERPVTVPLPGTGQGREPAGAYEHDWDALTDMADGQPRPWVTAQYDGNCALCGARWEAGDELIRYDPDAGGWACSACGADEIA